MIIKARFLRDGQPYGKKYTYLSDIDVSAGDAVMLTDTAQGIVTAIDVPEEEVAAFRDKLKKISGIAEPLTQERYRIVLITDKEGNPRKDSRYPLRIGRICKKPQPIIDYPMEIEYIANADGSDYSGRYLRTSRVQAVWEAWKPENLLQVETMHSIYRFEKCED